MENTDAHWTQWGEFDPYRAVLFDEKYQRAFISDNRQEFFQTGEDYIASLILKLLRLYPNMTFGTALDFGSGVGRLSIPLAKRFQKVIGIDISPAMLIESRNNCSSLGISNAEFLPSNDSLSHVPFGVDLVHSFLVLQHIPISRGLVIVNNLVNRLAPGGACALHVAIDRDPAPFKSIAYFAKHTFPGSRYILNVLQGKNMREPLMQINSYPIRALYDVIECAGLEDIWLFPLRGPHYSVICFGRKNL